MVVNPAAGGGRALRLLGAATAALAEAGAAFQVIRSASLDHARELAGAAAQRGDVVVAVGGDGLAGALAGAVSAAGGSYGIIPAGRGNDFALVLGLPADPAAAARLLAGGQVRAMDLIGVGVPGQPEATAALSAYLGVPSQAGEIANRARLLHGPMVYPVAALRVLARWKPATFRIGPGGLAGIPDGAFAGYAVVVANCACAGGGMKVAPLAEIDDSAPGRIHDAARPEARVHQDPAEDRTGRITLPQIGVGQAAEVTVTCGPAHAGRGRRRALPCAARSPPGHRCGSRVPCLARHRHLENGGAEAV
jgi:diacylglycerol kinase family enzyme